MVRNVALWFPCALLLLVALVPSTAQAYNHTLDGFAPTNGQDGHIGTFHAINDIVIRNVSINSFNTGDFDIEIWFNPVSNLASDPNWELKGVETVNFATAQTPTLVPIDIDGLVAAGTTFGIAVRNHNVLMAYADGPQTDISDDNLIIVGDAGWGGGYDPGAEPPISPTFTPRIFAGRVHYDLKGQGYVPNNSHRGHIAQFEATSDIVVREMSYVLSGSGVGEVEIWFNPNSAEPGHSDWTYQGTAEVTFATSTMTRIPVPINRLVRAGTTFGVAFVGVSGSQFSVRYSNGPQADKSDGNLIISGDNGWGGEYDPNVSPPIDASFSPRLFSGILHYDVALQGHDADDSHRGHIGEFEAIQDLVVRNIAVPMTASGTHTVEVWFNPNTAQPGDENWVRKGSSNVVVTTTGSPTMIPIAIDAFVAQGTTFGVATVLTTGGAEIRTKDGTASPISDAYLSYSGSNGWAGGFSSSLTPPVSAATSPQLFTGFVHYDPAGDPMVEVEHEGVGLGVGANNTLDLGTITVGSTANLALSVHNRGANETLSIVTPLSVDVVQGDFASGPMISLSGSNNIAPGGQGQVALQFEGDATGAFEFSFTIESNDPINPQYVVSVQGTFATPSSSDDGGGDGGCASGNGNASLGTMLAALLTLLSLGAMRRRLAG